MQAWLETGSGEQIALVGVCSIGRSSKNTLVLEGPEVSRRHGLIHVQGGEHWLVDLGSSNGILLNRHRVRQPVRLEDGDGIQIAGTGFLFRKASRAASKAESAETTLPTLKSSRTASHWLLVADIEGSTRLCQALRVEELAQLVGRWFLFGKETVEQFGGTIANFTGDGYFAYWPEPGQATEAIAQAIAEFETRQKTASPAFRLAVHYGSITVNNEVVEGQEQLLGAEVVFVFRMEKLAATLGQRCLLSEPAAHHLRAFREVVPVGAHSVAGFERKYDFFA